MNFEEISLSELENLSFSDKIKYCNYIVDLNYKSGYKLSIPQVMNSTFGKESLEQYREYLRLQRIANII